MPSSEMSSFASSCSALLVPSCPVAGLAPRRPLSGEISGAPSPAFRKRPPAPLVLRAACSCLDLCM